MSDTVGSPCLEVHTGKARVRIQFVDEGGHPKGCNGTIFEDNVLVRRRQSGEIMNPRGCLRVGYRLPVRRTRVSPMPSTIDLQRLAVQESPHFLARRLVTEGGAMARHISWRQVRRRCARSRSGGRGVCGGQ